MLTRFADWATYTLLKMQTGTLLAGAVHFFIYDIIKIYILLVLVVFAVSMVQTWLSPEKIKRILVRRGEVFSNVLAALMGAAAPFCSCSAIPLFIGFVESGVPLGATMSFLVASPMITPQGIVLLWGLFGARVALLYVAMGVVIAIMSGWIIGRLHLERWVENYVYQIQMGAAVSLKAPALKERVQSSWGMVRQILRKVALWVAIGVAVGAFIHGYAPEGFMAKYAGRDNPFAVLIAVVVGIPLYASSEGIIPVVQALWAKGLPLGTTLAFMMSVVGLSLPEIIILRRVLKPRLLATFVGIVGLGIVIVGYIFNWLM